MPPRAVKAGGSPAAVAESLGHACWYYSPPPRKAEEAPSSRVWALSDDESHCCSHHDNAVITTVELRRTGGAGAPVLQGAFPRFLQTPGGRPPLTPVSPIHRADRCSCPEKAGRDTEERGGTTTHTLPLASRVGKGGAPLSVARKARGVPGNRQRPRGGAAAATLEQAGDG